MSLPHKKNEVFFDAVVEDLVSSPDENDDRSTSMEVYQKARNLEENEETSHLLRNSSDADISSSDSVQTVLDLSCKKATESQKEDIPTGTGSKLQRSPKKVFKRTKMDSKIQGEREDDSSDETEVEYYKKSAKRIKCDKDIVDSVSESSTVTSGIPKSALKRGRVVSEKLVDSKYDSRNETDTKSVQRKSDILDNQSLFCQNLQSSNLQSDTVENFSDILTRSASKISPDKFKTEKSEPTEIVAAISEDTVDQSVEAGFTHVKSSDLIAAAVACSIHKPERSPQSRTSNDDEEEIKHDIELKIKFKEKEQSDADEVESHETQVKASEIISAAMSSNYENPEGIKYKDISSKSTEHCSVQSVGIEKTEYSSESNLSIERMEYSSESNIDRSIGINTDIEKMEFSSESCIGFESVKSGNDSNMSFEKMECNSESSLSREEMEIETVSLKSTDVELMEYSSESVLVESESIISQDSENITCNESESNSNEMTNIVVSNIDQSLEIQRDPIPIPCILVESEYNRNEVKNINESNIDESLGTQRKLSIPQILVESESIGNEGENIIQSNVDESIETQKEGSPHILVKSEFDNDSESNSNEVKNIIESNIGESFGIERKFPNPHIESSDTDEYEYDQNRGDIKRKDSNVSKKMASEDQFINVEESSNLDEPSFKRKKSVGDQEIKNASASNTGESTDTQKDTAVPRVEFSDTDSNEFGDKEIKSKKSPSKFKKRK